MEQFIDALNLSCWVFAVGYPIFRGLQGIGEYYAPEHEMRRVLFSSEFMLFITNKTLWTYPSLWWLFVVVYLMAG